MEHHFNVEVAKKYGVTEAIFIHHIKFWTLQNLANRRNIRLGFCWTYNTLEAFTELFPYWNKRQIEHLINKVIDAGAVAKTNLNIKKYDRTCWYALTAQLFPMYLDLSTPTYVDLLIDSHEKDKKEVDETGILLISLISQKCEMDFTKLRNGFHKNVTPIPDNNPGSNLKIKSFCDKNEQKKHKSVDKTGNAVSTLPAKKKDWKEANQTKHSWADKAKEPPRADVTKQSTSYDPSQHADTPRFDPNAPGYQAFINSNPTLKRKYERRKREENKATELSTGTPVQPEIPSRSVINEQGAAIDVERGKDNPSTIRGSNGLLEARRVHSYLEEAGMACAN